VVTTLSSLVSARQENQSKRGAFSISARWVDGILLAPVVGTGWGSSIKKRMRTPQIPGGVDWTGCAGFPVKSLSDFKGRGRFAASLVLAAKPRALYIVRACTVSVGFLAAI